MAELSKFRINGVECALKDETARNSGGYYTPAVSQLDASTMRIRFNRSNTSMPNIAAKDITLPSGANYVLTEEDKTEIAEMAAELVEVPDSGGNVDLTGVVKSVNGNTPDENGNVQIAVSSGGAGWTTAQIDLLDSLFSAIPWTTATAGALADYLIASLRSTSSGGGNTGGGSGGENEPETGATDNITQSGNTLIITSLANAPTLSGGVLTIA